VPGGGLSLDHSRWIRSPPHFFLPVRVLSRVFRGKFVDGLRQACQRKQIAFHSDLQPLANEKAAFDNSTWPTLIIPTGPL
jgi:hypothetical protein